MLDPFDDISSPYLDLVVTDLENVLELNEIVEKIYNAEFLVLLLQDLILY